MATELAKAYVQIVPSAEGIGGSIESVIAPEAESAGKSAGEKVSGGLLSGIGGVAKTGVAAFGAIAGAGTAAAGALVAGVGSVAEYGDNIDKMSQKMGMSVESYQEWDAVMKHSGTSMETMKSSMKTLANAAESGSDAFDKLGISQEEIANMSQEELFEATIKALQNVDDETERTYLAGKTLGRGATELGALLNTSAEETQAMRDRVRELGGVMSEDAVKSAAVYQDSLQDMTTAFTGLKNNLLAEFLPSITTVMDGLTEIFAGNSGEGIGMVTEGINNLLMGILDALPQVADGATQIFTALAETLIANLPQIVDVGLQIIISLAGAIMENLPLIGEALLGVGEVIVNTLLEYGPTLLEQGFNMIENLVMGIIENAPAMVDNFGELVNQALAFIEEHLPDFLDKGISFITNMVTGIYETAPEVISSMGEIVTNVISFLMEHLPEYLEKGVEMIQNIAQGIMNNLPEILTTMGTVIADIIGTIAEHLPDFLEKGVSLLLELGKGLIQAIPDLLAQLPEIFDSVLDEFGKFDWAGIGMDIINGIIDGVANAADSLVDAATGAIGDAFDSVKNWLGIASPSKKARDILGKNWALGIGEGFEENMPEAEMTAQVKATMSGMNGALLSMPTVKTSGSNVEGIISSINELKSAILSMQIVMDSGETVGAIAELMDGALGNNARRTAWQ